MFALRHILIIKAADGAGPDLSRETPRFGRGPPELKAQLVAFAGIYRHQMEVEIHMDVCMRLNINNSDRLRVWWFHPEATAAARQTRDQVQHQKTGINIGAAFQQMERGDINNFSCIIARLKTRVCDKCTTKQHKIYPNVTKTQRSPEHKKSRRRITRAWNNLGNAWSSFWIWEDQVVKRLKMTEPISHN